MAKVIIRLNEAKLTSSLLAAREAERAGDSSKSTLEFLGLDIHHIWVMSHRYFELGKITHALDGVDWMSCGAVDSLALVERMVGYCQAARMFLRDGVPVEGETVQATWSVWAHMRLGRGGAPLMPADEMRGAIGDKLDDLEQWNTWAQFRLSNELGNGTPWDGSQELLRYEMTRVIDRLQALAQKAVSPAPADTAESWDKWAQRALGLSDAYVEDQKITTDDLRRMISERL